MRASRGRAGSRQIASWAAHEVACATLEADALLATKLRTPSCETEWSAPAAAPPGSVCVTPRAAVTHLGFSGLAHCWQGVTGAVATACCSWSRACAALHHHRQYGRERHWQATLEHDDRCPRQQFWRQADPAAAVSAEVAVAAEPEARRAAAAALLLLRCTEALLPRACLSGSLWYTSAAGAPLPAALRATGALPPAVLPAAGALLPRAPLPALPVAGALPPAGLPLVTARQASLCPPSFQCTTWHSFEPADGAGQGGREVSRAVARAPADGTRAFSSPALSLPSFPTAAPGALLYICSQ